MLHSVCAVGCLVVSMAIRSSGQTVTLDFTFTSPPGPGSHLPWQEDGFTVTGWTTSNSTMLNPRVATVSGGGVSGVLLFSGGTKVVANALITNDSASHFDLLSFDVVGLDLAHHGPTNFARITSSAGGVFDLFGTTPRSTLSFSGSQWEGLSDLKIEFLYEGDGTPPYVFPVLSLDNFVLHTVAVPEPSVCALVGSAGCWLLLLRQRIKPRAGR